MKSYKKIYDLYIEKDEEFLIKYIVPEHYVDENNVTDDFAITFLQNELNTLLNSFVNGGFSYKGYLLYPLNKDLSQENKRKIKRLNKIAVFLNSEGYDFSNSIKKYKRDINSRNCAIILSALYQDYSQIKSKSTKEVKKLKCQEFKISSYKKNDIGYLRPLNKLKEYANKNLKSHLSGFYLHGSFSTKDYIKGWSDVDTLSIISKETINDPRKILKVRDLIYHSRRFYYEMDPLQHHGTMVMTEYDLSSYCQTYFPIPVFRYSKSFFKDDKQMQFKNRDFSSEALKSLFWFVSYFRKMNIEKKYSLDSYETKNLLHATTLFPTLYLQAKGKVMYKKFSFNKAKKDFKKEEWDIIEYVSSLRKNWKGLGTLPLIKLFSNINPLSCYQANARILDIFDSTTKKNDVNIKKICEEMYNFSEQAWNKIKKNAKLR